MEGKTIVKTLELGEGITVLKMDDGTFASVKVIDPEIPADVIEEFLGEEPAKPAKEEKKAVKEEPKKEKKAEPEEDPDDELDWDALQAMGAKALKKLIKDKRLLTDPDDFEDDEDGLRKEIAEELDIEVPKKEKKAKKDEDEDEDEPKGKKGKKDEDEDEPEDDDAGDYTWADLKEMDWEELVALCKENKAETDPDDFDEDPVKLRKAIAKEFGIEVPSKK